MVDSILNHFASWMGELLLSILVFQLISSFTRNNWPSQCWCRMTTWWWGSWLFDSYIFWLRPKVTCICTTLECHLVEFFREFYPTFVDFPVPSNRSGDKICMIFSVKNPGTNTVIALGQLDLVHQLGENRRMWKFSESFPGSSGCPRKDSNTKPTAPWRPNLRKKHMDPMDGCLYTNLTW